MAQLVPSAPFRTHLSDPGWSSVVTALESEPCSAYIVARDLSLAYVNAGWRRFAQDNGAPLLAEGCRSLGPMLSGLSPALRSFFSVRLEATLSGNRAWSHTYECSSPESYRRFHMRARAGPGQEGLIVIHSLVAEIRVDSHAPHRLVQQFTDERGLIVRCAACGRTRRPGDRDQWDWVPTLEREPNISTGICAVCSVQEYGF